MEYTELITILLLVGLFVVLYIKQPTKMYNVIVRAVINDVEKNQNEISAKLYKKLPASVREKITTEELATIVTNIMSVVLDVLKDKTNDNSKKEN